MEIWQLRCAVQAAESGSMNKAAKELKTAQSVVSKTIKELEAEIGCSLFVRTAGGIHVTKQGAEFLMYAHSILEQTDYLSSFYQPMSKKMELGRKQVSICIPQLEEMDYMTLALQRWFRVYGKEISRFSLSSDNIEDALSYLASGEIQMAIFRIKNRDRLYWEHKLHVFPSHDTTDADTTRPSTHGIHTTTTNNRNAASKSVNKVSEHTGNHVSNICDTKKSAIHTPAPRFHISTLWEFRKKILVDAHHPLASIHEIPFSALRPYSEIISDKNREPADGQISVPNRSLVFSCLKSIPGSYTFSSPVPDEILIREGLKEKELSCENISFPDFAPDLFYQDIAVWQDTLDDSCHLLLEYVKQELPPQSVSHSVF